MCGYPGGPLINIWREVIYAQVWQTIETIVLTFASPQCLLVIVLGLVVDAGRKGGVAYVGLLVGRSVRRDSLGREQVDNRGIGWHCQSSPNHHI